MTPTRFRECLEKFQWTQRGFARFTGRCEGTVRQWARGRVAIPYSIAEWLEGMTNYIEHHPIPTKPIPPFLQENSQ